MGKIYRVSETYTSGMYEDATYYVVEYGVFSSVKAAQDRRDAVVHQKYPGAALLVGLSTTMPGRLATSYEDYSVALTHEHRYICIDIEEYVLDKPIESEKSL